MPEISWFPVLTLLLGFATKTLTDWLEHRRNTSREREAREAVRRDQLFERRTTFQRQTLLDLQEAAMQATRFTSMIHQHDKRAYRSTGERNKERLPDDVDEGSRLAHARTGMLGARVRDDSIRELIEKLQTHYQEVVLSKTREDSDSAMNETLLVFYQLNQRTGEVFRKLDDADQIDFP
jgi:hypothetical protein